MALNSQLAHAIRPIRSDVLSGFAVASHVRESPPKQVDLRLITFGMAHKIQSKGYQRVGELLGADEREFVLEISSALHEGTAFDDSFFTVGDEISRCFGGNVEFLGFLADNEVARRLDRADAMLAFFPSGVRENNTSVIGAMSIGLPVITNLDRWSPSWARHGESVFDVNQLDRFPTNRELRQVGERGQQSILHLTFSRLTALLSSES
jgi:glycosyltransferase involved in cell wall biosynthesis